MLQQGDVDTVYVTDVIGATLDSLSLDTSRHSFRLSLTLDSDTTSQVTFTVAGTFGLAAGPCAFSRAFSATIDNGTVDVTQSKRELPLAVGRDIRIKLVERNGLRVRLRAVGAGDLPVVWNVTAGGVERSGETDIVWQLPPEPGFYQAELFVERGERGFGFDTLSLEVS
jgi:hypothetical protein